MSKFTASVRALRGQRVYLPDDMRIRSLTLSETSACADIGYIYDIQATFGARVQCREQDLARSVTKTKEHLIEHLFGEFRPRLFEVREKLYDRDFSGADAALEKLYNQMFSTEAE